MRTPHSSTMPGEAEAVQREGDVLRVIASASLSALLGDLTVESRDFP